jgi:hypothetical protein
MTTEARVAVVLFFFAVWCFLGLVPWAIAAVVARGRGALPALPIALAGACAAGVAVPLIGLDNFRGFLVSLVTALLAAAVGSIAGIRIAQQLWSAPTGGELHPGEATPEADAEGSHPRPRT